MFDNIYPTNPLTKYNWITPGVPVIKNNSSEEIKKFWFGIPSSNYCESRFDKLTK